MPWRRRCCQSGAAGPYKISATRHPLRTDGGGVATPVRFREPKYEQVPPCGFFPGGQKFSGRPSAGICLEWFLPPPSWFGPAAPVYCICPNTGVNFSDQRKYLSCSQRVIWLAWNWLHKPSSGRISKRSKLSVLNLHYWTFVSISGVWRSVEQYKLTIGDFVSSLIKYTKCAQNNASKRDQGSGMFRCFFFII